MTHFSLSVGSYKKVVLCISNILSLHTPFKEDLNSINYCIICSEITNFSLGVESYKKVVLCISVIPSFCLRHEEDLSNIKYYIILL